MDIPLIDISGFEAGDPARRQAVARAWGEAFETAGFATILGHGLSEAQLDGIHDEARRFFDLPLAAKMRAHDPRRPAEGYLPIGLESVGRSMGVETPGDLCEAVQFVNLHSGEHRAELWPDSMRELRPTLEAFAGALAALELRLMRISAVALGLAADYFDAFYTPMTTKLRLVEYPDQVEEPLPGQFRNASHTDFGGFTILRQDDAPGGLQVLIGSEWVDVRPVRGTLVINAGDLIQRWTNDRWRSNHHRVINPPRGLTGSTRRLSIVMFTNPNPDTIVSCLPTCLGPEGRAKYQPINSAEHTRERARLLTA